MRLVPLAIAALLLVPVSVVASHALATTSVPPPTDDSPPPRQVDGATTQRFLDTWNARLTDDAWLQGYLADSAPVQDEFSSLSEAAKADLTHSLLDEILQQDPEMVARVHPPGAPQEWGARENFTLTFLRGVVFDKASLKQDMAEPAEAALPNIVAARESVPVARDPLTGAVLAPGETMDAHLQASRTATAMPVAALLDAAPGLAGAVAPVAEQAMPVDPAPVFTMSAVASPVPLQPGFGALPDFPLPGVGDVQPTATGLVPLLTYQACSQPVTGSPVCAPMAVPLGTPVVLSVDGTHTLLVELLPIPVPATTDAASVLGAVQDLPPPALNLQLRVHSLTGPVPAKAWVLLALPDASLLPTKLLRVGVDATGSRLPDASVLTFHVDDLTQLWNGHASGKLDATFTNPGLQLTMMGELDDLDVSGVASNPTIVAAGLAPVRDLDVAFDAQLDGSRAVANITTSGPTLLTFTYAALRNALSTTAQASLDQFPGYAQVRFTRESAGVLRVGLDSSASMARLRGAYVRSEPGSYDAGTLALDNLPRSVDVRIAVTAAQGDVQWTASAPTGRVTLNATHTAGSLTTSLGVGITSIPSRAHITWDVASSTGSLVWDANGSAGLVDFAISSGPGQLAARGSVSAMPPYLQATFTTSLLVLDARTSATAPSASSSLGTLKLAWAQDGQLLTGLPSNDHVLISQPTWANTRADVQYTGLRYGRMDLRGVDFTGELKGTTPRYLSFAASTPDANATGWLDSVPAHLLVDQSGSGETITIDTFGSGMQHLHLDFADKHSPLTLSADAHAVPGSLVLDTGAHTQHAVYTASGSVQWVRASAHVPIPGFPAVNVALNVSAVPTAWDVDSRNGAFAFNANAPIGSIDLVARTEDLPPPDPNSFQQRSVSIAPLCGQVSWLPVLVVPSHLCATLDVPAQSASVVFHLAGAQRVSSTPDPRGVLVAAKVVGNPRFILDVDGTMSGTQRAKAHVDLSALPADLQVLTGSTFSYRANAPLDVTIDATYGHPSAFGSIPSVPLPVEGVAVRDGGSSTQHAVRGRVHLTGLPNGFDVGPSGSFLPALNCNPCVSMLGLPNTVVLDAQGWKPQHTTLTVDVDVQRTLPQRLLLNASIQNLVPYAGATQSLHAEFGAQE
ncbi:MAG: hypothetical protein LC624_04835, partial [Halobacteriales archaeon]|nr:hypothetical protein [Halobacteriales archaeon]